MIPSIGQDKACILLNNFIFIIGIKLIVYLQKIL